MNSAAVPTLAAIVVQVALGLAVFQANARTRSNQCFLLLSLAIGAWLGSLYFTFTASNTEAAAFYIRQASAAGALTLAVFNLLRISIGKPQLSWRAIFLESRVWLIAVLFVIVLCQTDFFLRGARFSQSDGITGATSVPIYGSGSILYVFYFLAAGTAIIVNYFRDVKNAIGTWREPNSHSF